MKNKDYETVLLDKFYIIGISVRTTNQNGQAQSDIAKLWQRFMSENLMAQIPNKVNDDIYCMYTDYESDFRGLYTTILGCKVASLEDIPDGFIGKEIPQTAYKMYKAIGKLPDCVGRTWNEIWQSGIDRAYAADFDLYSVASNDPQNAEVSIFLS